MELAAREKRKQELATSKGAEQVSKAIQNLKGLNTKGRGTANIFQQLYAKGQGLTFDDLGCPMVYKQSQPDSQNFITSLPFEIKNNVEVTHIEQEKKPKDRATI